MGPPRTLSGKGVAAMTRTDKIIVGVGVLLVGYMVVAGNLALRNQRRTTDEQQAVEVTQGEGETETMTQGMAAAGTILKRDGVAVAELWAMKELGAVEGAVVDFTAHDAAYRYRVFQQGLREMTRVGIIGNHLPATSAEWLGDINSGEVHVYTVVFPDDSEIVFRAFVVRVATRPPLADRLIFEADICPVPIPPYWHCYAEGSGETPPPDDEGHWEPVPPQEVDPDWPVFGYDVASTVALRGAASVIGTVFPFPAGAPTASVYAEGAEEDWPTWPDPATLLEEEVGRCYSIHCGYDAESKQALVIHAYMEFPLDSGLGTDQMKAGIYRASDGVFMGATEVLVITEGDPPAWYDFEFGDEGPVLVEETEYALVVWSVEPVVVQVSLWGDELEDYVAPAGGVIWVPDPPDPYPICTIVFYED